MAGQNGNGRPAGTVIPLRGAKHWRGPSSATDPLADAFSRREIARLLGLSERRLRTLDEHGIVSPSTERGGRRMYTFTDLIALRTAQGLLARRVRLREVVDALANLRRALPSVKRPLTELRVLADGSRVVVRADGEAFEPVTRQRLLDLDVRTLRDDVVRVLRPANKTDRAKQAYDCYLRASELDEKPATMDEAERLYRRALDLDPSLAIAITNLGNIRFRRHDQPGAEELYRRALEVDARQPEAQYNLGYLVLERGQPDAAIPLFHGAIQADPSFSDAYFNLAMAYEQSGHPSDAKTYWRGYIGLEPEGTWSDIARQHL